MQTRSTELSLLINEKDRTYLLTADIVQVPNKTDINSLIYMPDNPNNIQASTSVDNTDNPLMHEQKVAAIIKNSKPIYSHSDIKRSLLHALSIAQPELYADATVSKINEVIMTVKVNRFNEEGDVQCGYKLEYHTDARYTYYSRPGVMKEPAEGEVAACSTLQRQGYLHDEVGDLLWLCNINSWCYGSALYKYKRDNIS